MNNNISLYIKRAEQHHTKEFIEAAFASNKIGQVRELQFIKKTDTNGREYNGVIVMFEYWNMNILVKNLMDQMAVSQDGTTRFTFDSYKGRYWIVNVYKQPQLNLNLDLDDIEDDVDDITCIDRVISKIEIERDELEEYWQKLKTYNKYKKQMENGYPTNDLEDDEILDLFNPITNNFEKPKHKYNGRIPMIAILFDDVVGSMLFTKGIRKLNKLTIYHRHIAPFADLGGAIGCSLYFLIQSYKDKLQKL